MELFINVFIVYLSMYLLSGINIAIILSNTKVRVVILLSLYKRWEHIFFSIAHTILQHDPSSHRTIFHWCVHEPLKQQQKEALQATSLTEISLQRSPILILPIHMCESGIACVGVIEPSNVTSKTSHKYLN